MFSDAEALDMRQMWEEAMQETMAVYTEDGAGAYTMVAQAALACRIITSQWRTGTAPDRGERAASDFVTWPASYVLPETAQLLLRGARWTVVAGSGEQTRLGPSALLVKQRVEIVRAAA